MINLKRASYPKGLKNIPRIKLALAISFRVIFTIHTSFSWFSFKYNLKYYLPFVKELFLDKQFVSLLKLTIAKIHLLLVQQNQTKDLETKEYLSKAVQQHRVMLGYLLQSKNMATRIC